jgi:uncharacterized OsmC-like protein
MRIIASVQNRFSEHQILLSTNDATHTIAIPPKPTGYGSSANGGELLFLALATCYCNDVYREAAAQGIEVTAVEVEVDGDFGAPGEPGRNITYRAKITGKADPAALEALARHTDTMAEIQNTLRGGATVHLGEIEVESLT